MSSRIRAELMSTCADGEGSKRFSGRNDVFSGMFRPVENDGDSASTLLPSAAGWNGIWFPIEDPVNANMWLFCAPPSEWASSKLEVELVPDEGKWFQISSVQIYQLGEKHDSITVDLPKADG